MDMSLSKLWEIMKASLACCSPWGHKELETTQQLNDNSKSKSPDLSWFFLVLQIIVMNIHSLNKYTELP